MTDYTDYFDYLRSRNHVGLPHRRLLIGVPGERGYQCDPNHKIFYGDTDLRRVVSASGSFCGRVFHAPMKNQWLASWRPLYCLCGIFGQS